MAEDARQLAFKPGEYEDRLQRVRSRMAENSIDSGAAIGTVKRLIQFTQDCRSQATLLVG